MLPQQPTIAPLELAVKETDQVVPVAPAATVEGVTTRLLIDFAAVNEPGAGSATGEESELVNTVIPENATLAAGFLTLVMVSSTESPGFDLLLIP
jgi:hypothetical protein